MTTGNEDNIPAGEDKSQMQRAEQVKTNRDVHQPQRESGQPELVVLQNEVLRAQVELLKRSTDNLKWALGMIIAFALLAMGLTVFQSREKYKEAVNEARKAAVDARAEAREAVRLREQTEEKAQRAIEEATGLLREVQATADRLDQPFDEWCRKKDSEIESRIEDWLALAETKAEARLDEVMKAGEALQKQVQNEPRIRDLWFEVERASRQGRDEFVIGTLERLSLLDPEDPAVWRRWGDELCDVAFEKQDSEEARGYYTRGIEYLRRALELAVDDCDTLTDLASELMNMVNEGLSLDAARDLTEAREKLDAALRLRPEDTRALRTLGSLHVVNADFAEGQDAERAFAESYKAFQRVITIEPDNRKAYLGWGLALMRHASRKSGDEAIQTYQEACAKYQQALSGEANDHTVLMLWGQALGDCGDLCEGHQATQFYQQAEIKYSIAYAMDPGKVMTLDAWSDVLVSLGRLKRAEGLEQEGLDLINKACEKREAAVRIDPTSDRFFRLGLAISDLANGRRIRDVDDLMRRACDDFELAALMEPDEAWPLSMWGKLLIFRAVNRTGDQRNVMLVAGKQKLLRANELDPTLSGQLAYDLAFASAMLRDEHECRAWLEEGQGKEGFPSLAAVTRDGYLRRYSRRSWFKQIKWGEMEGQ